MAAIGPMDEAHQIQPGQDSQRAIDGPQTESGVLASAPVEDLERRQALSGGGDRLTDRLTRPRVRVPRLHQPAKWGLVATRRAFPAVFLRRTLIFHTANCSAGARYGQVSPLRLLLVPAWTEAILVAMQHLDRPLAAR